MSNGILPISKQEMEERGITQLDFVYVIGDAYVDHPSFGHAIISRVLEANGYTVGIISQPDWKKKEKHRCIRRAETGLSCNGRQYGFYGKPLFRIKKAEEYGCLYSGRIGRKETGLCNGGLL